MNNLYQQRRNKHFLLLLKYWKYVFNDHFVIALFFLFGALAYGYSQALPKLTPGIWWGKPLILVVLIGLVQLGRLATLVKTPDPIFLLPQAKKIRTYLTKAYLASLVLAQLIVAAGFVIAVPFLKIVVGLSITSIVVLYLILFGLKWLIMNNAFISLYQFQPAFSTNQLLWSLLIPVAGIGCALWINGWLGLLIVVLLLGWSFILKQRTTQHVLNWRRTVDRENQRMLGIYRFFNLFTDVPMVQGTVKRRRYLDFALTPFKRSNQIYSYLYARGLIRGTEVSGLILRLTAIAMVILFFVPQGILNIILLMLFIYLVAVQLVPFYWHFDNYVFIHLYPQPQKIKLANFQTIMQWTLLCCAGLMLIASVWSHFSLMQSALKIVIAFVECLFLSRQYVVRRIKSKL